MSLVNQVVHAQCPNCKNTLRIPASWIGEPMKCKHCGTVFQAKAPPKKKGNIVGRAIRAATTLHKRRRRRKKKDKSNPRQGVVPVAKPVMNMGGTAPTAIPVPAGLARSGAVPVAAAIPAGFGKGQKPGSRPRSRRSWQKIAFVLFFFLGVGSFAAIIYQANSGQTSGENQLASVAPTGGATAPGTSAKTDPKGTPTTKSGEPTQSTKPKTEPFVAKNTTRKTEREKSPPPPTKKNPPTTRKRPPIDTETTRPEPMPVYPVADKPNDAAYKNWPRRMLAISINNYLYQNPVSYGREKSFDKAVNSLSSALKVPNDQVTMITDRITGPKAAPPTRAILVDAISRFLNESRPVDHVVLLFAGHGLELEGVPYLVPLMGDKDDVASLISLDWLYSRLAACPAQQKLLVLDVARNDPTAGEQFGKTEPLGAQFAALLQKPPKGVQVLASCSAGQYSYEVQNDKFTPPIHGGIFQESIVDLAGTLRGVEQKTDGPIPADDLAKMLSRRLTGYMPKVQLHLGQSALAKAGTKPKEAKEEKEEAPAKAEQSLQFSGTLFVKAIGSDGKSESAKKLTVSRDADPVFRDGIATPSEIRDLLTEQRAIPPLKPDENVDFYSNLPFSRKSLAAYLAKDDKDSDLRDFVRKGIAVLNDPKTRQAFVKTMGPLPDNVQQKNAVINGLQQRQENLAAVYAEIDGAFQQLKTVEKDREMEAPRWRAAYDYVMARLLFQMVHFYEYQVAMGNVRKENLPTFDKNAHTRYELVPKSDLSDRGEEQDLAKQAKKALERLAKDAKATPWEVLAKREMNTSLGLQWVAK